MSDENTYSGEFLNQFPAHKRGALGNQFYNAARAGMREVSHVIEWVRSDALRRHASAMRNQRSEDAELQGKLVCALGSEEAERFAQYVLWRESLPMAEREAHKREKGAEYVKNYMAEQPPTGKQLNYLKSLGCSVVPASKLEASQLIDERLRERKGNDL